MTNGDGYINAELLTPEDYISLGEKRQQEASRATGKLGLRKEDIIFLSYPDSGLSSLWGERYNANRENSKTAPYNFYKSKTTKNISSPYKITYNHAKKGYTRENLILDIQDILKEYKPKSIYTPHLLDGSFDHQATTRLVFEALNELAGTGKDNWIGSLGVSYYLIHPPVMESGQGYSIWPDKNSASLDAPAVFTEKPPRSENIVSFKQNKKQALEEYRTQLNIEETKILPESFIKDNEIFWDAPLDKLSHLNDVGDEWERIGRIMQNQGYNVNFGTVADIADSLEDMRNPLARKRRMYSEHPSFVAELVLYAVTGMDKTGVIPVVKHFPGLGSSNADTHISLPVIKKSKKELYKRDLVPFKELIKKNGHFWVMSDHAIYPYLSREPASLSYAVQTQILREELGFEGVIITDELLNMQAIEEYARIEKIKEPYIGEIIVRAFQSGADIGLFYVSSPQQAKKVIVEVINSVEQAVVKGKIKEEEIDASVRRILKDKERIFKQPLEYLLKDMDLKEKISQKLFTDTYTSKEEDTREWLEILKEYNLAGILPRNSKIIPQLQNNSKIPLFIATQYEGGLITYGHNFCTRSAYIMGREFERLILKAGIKIPCLSLKKTKVRYLYSERIAFSLFSKLNRARRQALAASLLNSIDKLIKAWSELEEKGYTAPNPNHLSPLTIYSNGRFEIKPYEDMADLPVAWTKKFPDEDTALCAYYLFKKAFDDWPDSQKRAKEASSIVPRLTSFRERVEEQTSKIDKSRVRILCLAAHPDDEDGEALAYFSKKFNCETYVLLATRGEGGENKIGSARNEKLGLLRTKEMEKAASILGVKKVYYLGKTDFGYTPSIAEVFQKWGKEDTLEKLVHFIRLIKPQIIITKHNEANLKEHGQHRALVMLAKEAFDLAGSPGVYPEMIADGLLPWQPLKFYQRAIEMNAFPVKITINPDEYIFSGNKTYRQISMEALRQHRTQGIFKWFKETGDASYQLVESKVKQVYPEGSFFAGIN